MCIILNVRDGRKQVSSTHAYICFATKRPHGRKDAKPISFHSCIDNQRF